MNITYNGVVYRVETEAELLALLARILPRVA